MLYSNNLYAATQGLFAMPKSKKMPLGLRLDPDLVVAARKAAALESRTLTNLIEILLRERCHYHGITVDSASEKISPA